MLNFSVLSGKLSLWLSHVILEEKSADPHNLSLDLPAHGLLSNGGITHCR